MRAWWRSWKVILQPVLFAIVIFNVIFWPLVFLIHDSSSSSAAPSSRHKEVITDPRLGWVYIGEPPGDRHINGNWEHCAGPNLVYENNFHGALTVSVRDKQCLPSQGAHHAATTSAPHDVPVGFQSPGDASAQTTQHRPQPAFLRWAQSPRVQALIQCESTHHYKEVATYNGVTYYGAYQFDLPTWRSVHGPGIPSKQSERTQDRFAYRLFTQRGWEPWQCAQGH